MTPKIPAALMARRNEAVTAVTSAAVTRRALDDAMELLLRAVALADEAKDNAETVAERVEREIRAALASVPGACVDGGLADVSEDKSGALLLCMQDGRDLPVDVE